MALLASSFRQIKSMLSHRYRTSDHYSFMLLLLACFSMSNIPLKVLISRMASIPNIIGPISEIFKKIKILTEKWSYKLHDAYNSILEDIKDKRLRATILRMGQTIKVGASISDFSRIELERYMTTSEAEFDRGIDRLKRLIEAYSALLTSFAFLSVAMLLTSMIYGGIDPSVVLMTSATMIVSSLSAILFLMYRSSPRIYVFHSCDIRPRRLESLERMFLIAIPSSILATISFMIVPMVRGSSMIAPMVPSISFSFLIGSVLPLYIGIKARKLIMDIKDMDSTFPTFLKAFSDSMAISGSIKAALKTVLLNEYGKLTRSIRNLLNRVKIGVQTENALQLFGAETGSRIIYTCSMILAECIRVGARATIYGKILIDYVTSILIRRNKVSQVAGSLKGIVMPLQVTFSAVLALIKSLTELFGKFATLVVPYISFIQIPSAQSIEIYFFVILISITVSNSLAVYFVEGESKFTLSLYFGMLMLLSAISFFFVYASVDAFFNAISRLEELGSIVR